MAKPAAVTRESILKELGRIGGKARAKKLSGERRSEVARIAARARWDKRGQQERQAIA
jgi:hypothetical protein